jgi:diguanylate cyclase (GGDEF)-like protein
MSSHEDTDALGSVREKQAAVFIFVVLSIIALCFMVFAVSMHRLISANNEMAEVINTAGMQRTLSQKLLSTVLLGENSQVSVEQVSNTLLENHEYLADFFETSGSKLDEQARDNIWNIFYQPPHSLFKTLSAYTEQVKDISAFDKLDLANLSLATDALIQAHDAVVLEYQLFNQRKVSSQTSLSMIGGSLFLLMLTLVGYFVMRPVSSLIINVEKRMLQAASIDPLSNLFNRRAFYSHAEGLLNLCQRNKKPVSLVAIDIDHFKNINDTYGHAVGDEVISHLSKAIKKNSRSSDLSARFGGEEFLLMLPETNLDEAANAFGEKIRKWILSNPYVNDGVVIPYTISVGVSEVFSFEDNLEFAMQRADSALYVAKEGGRNQVRTRMDNPEVVKDGSTERATNV